ncbi:hypothetical protein LN040_04295 [Desulfovibrio subterraneus]|uniref:hypothetical protein n=1 Tax=Desulfovibrio subterraneus TaxID=2718620 RepID=UPI0022B86679|nr:hypothetical protein [Desulfovibrio subterraneus]WBF68330.1 hypothetical protein LN040_04295 [Desulfovibrio subterraneus]
MSNAHSIFGKLGYATTCFAMLLIIPAAMAAQPDESHPSGPSAQLSPAQLAAPAATSHPEQDGKQATQTALQAQPAQAPAAVQNPAPLKTPAPVPQPGQQPVQNEATSCIPLPATQQTTGTSIAQPPVEQVEPAHLVKARDNLRDFAYTRLISMASRLCYTASKPNIEHKSDKWVATYKNISPDTLIVQVKPVEGAKNRFMGLIKYAVLHYEASADNKSLLAQQDYQMVKRLWQLEILRFDGKTWK